MRVLVTGSEGNLMQAVIPKLVDNGYEVFGVDNQFRHGNRKSIHRDSYTFKKVELTDRRAVIKLFANVMPDYVIQGAARIYGIGGFNRFCADILGEDLTLHNNVLLSALPHGTQRIVYISSSMVYETIQEGAVKEKYTDGIVTPYTDYGLSKLAGERLSKAFLEQYGLPYTIWRPFNIVSPNEDADYIFGNAHVFADLIQSIVLNQIAYGSQIVPIIGKGDQVRCFTHIDDVAQAIADYSFADKTENQTYNLGNKDPITIRELAEMIHEITTKDLGIDLPPLKLKTIRNYENDVKYRVPDVSKAKKDFGWKATTKTRDSIKECVIAAIARSGIKSCSSN